eukprot:754939-Hanusia_phi.AAC.1
MNKVRSKDKLQKLSRRRPHHVMLLLFYSRMLPRSCEGERRGCHSVIEELRHPILLLSPLLPPPFSSQSSANVGPSEDSNQ